MIGNFPTGIILWKLSPRYFMECDGWKNDPIHVLWSVMVLGNCPTDILWSMIILDMVAEAFIDGNG